MASWCEDRNRGFRATWDDVLIFDGRYLFDPHEKYQIEARLNDKLGNHSKLAGERHASSQSRTEFKSAGRRNDPAPPVLIPLTANPIEAPEATHEKHQPGIEN